MELYHEAFLPVYDNGKFSGEAYTFVIIRKNQNDPYFLRIVTTVKDLQNTKIASGTGYTVGDKKYNPDESDKSGSKIVLGLIKVILPKDYVEQLNSKFSSPKFSKDGAMNTTIRVESNTVVTSMPTFQTIVKDTKKVQIILVTKESVIKYTNNKYLTIL